MLNTDLVIYKNIFIMPRKDFFEYCEQLFEILTDYEKNYPHTGEDMSFNRRLGGIAEFVSSLIFYKYFTNQHQNHTYIPLIYHNSCHNTPVFTKRTTTYPKWLINLISAFILKKKNRHHFRKKFKK